MRKYLIIPLILLLISCSSISFNADLTIEKDRVIYPNDKTDEISVILDKNPKIQDVKYKLTIEGPASLEANRKTYERNIPLLDERIEQKLLLYLQDTSSANEEPITLNLQGEYISNSFFGGGKKTFNLTKTIYIISTEKGKVMEEMEAVEKEKLNCENDLKQCADEKTLLQQQNERLALEAESLRSMPPPVPKNQDSSRYLLYGLGALAFFSIILAIDFKLKLNDMKRRLATVYRERAAKEEQSREQMIHQGRPPYQPPFGPGPQGPPRF